MNETNNKPLRAPDERNLLQFSSFAGLEDLIHSPRQRFCRVMTKISGSKGPQSFQTIASGEFSPQSSSDSQEGREVHGVAKEKNPPILECSMGHKITTGDEDSLRRPLSLADVAGRKVKFPVIAKVKERKSREKSVESAFSNVSSPPESPRPSFLNTPNVQAVNKQPVRGFNGTGKYGPTGMSGSQREPVEGSSQTRAAEHNSTATLSTELINRQNNSSLPKGEPKCSDPVQGDLSKFQTYPGRIAKKESARLSWKLKHINSAEDAPAGDTLVASRKRKSLFNRTRLVCNIAQGSRINTSTVNSASTSGDVSHRIRENSSHLVGPCSTTKKQKDVPNDASRSKRVSVVRDFFIRIKGRAVVTNELPVTKGKELRADSCSNNRNGSMQQLSRRGSNSSELGDIEKQCKSTPENENGNAVAATVNDVKTVSIAGETSMNRHELAQKFGFEDWKDQNGETETSDEFAKKAADIEDFLDLMAELDRAT